MTTDGHYPPSGSEPNEPRDASRPPAAPDGAGPPPQPAVGPPTYGSPTYGSPTYGSPTYGPSTHGSPADPQQPGGYPGTYPAQPMYGPPPGPPPDNYLVWAILSTVLCCLPLGIVSIVYAAQVNDKWLRGDAAGATESARKAKQFATWSAAVHAALLVLIGIFYVGIFALAIGSGAATAP